MSDKIGKAYAFFDCNASKEQIEREIPFIRNAVKTPKQLELILTENVQTLNLDPNLVETALKRLKTPTKYVMQATYPNATNEQTASELGDILNATYNFLYQKNEKFRGQIAYEKDREYVTI